MGSFSFFKRNNYYERAHRYARTQGDDTPNVQQDNVNKPLQEKFINCLDCAEKARLTRREAEETFLATAPKPGIRSGKEQFITAFKHILGAIADQIKPATHKDYEYNFFLSLLNQVIDAPPEADLNNVMMDAITEKLKQSTPKTPQYDFLASLLKQAMDAKSKPTLKELIKEISKKMEQSSPHLDDEGSFLRSLLEQVTTSPSETDLKELIRTTLNTRELSAFSHKDMRKATTCRRIRSSLNELIGFQPEIIQKIGVEQSDSQYGYDIAKERIEATERSVHKLIEKQTSEPMSMESTEISTEPMKGPAT